MTKSSVWFVTGASKGLGLALVQRLLARGYRVAATSRSLAALTRELGDATDQFLPLELELGDERALERAIDRVIGTFGALDVVVNNAGYGQFGTVEETSDAEARRNFDINVFGLLNVLRATLPRLRGQRSGHVFNISSIGGYTGEFSGWGIYCATKFAVAGLTESLRSDLAPLGIRATLVYPGYFRTEFLSQGSLSRPAHPIADYATARASEKQHAEAINGNQPGDPIKAADALIAVYERGDSPVHLFLGSDAVARAEAKQEQVRAAIAAHRELSVSTNL